MTDPADTLWQDAVERIDPWQEDAVLGRGLDWGVTRTVFFEGQWHVFAEFLRS